MVDTSFEVGAIHDFALQVGGETVWVQAEVRRAVSAPRGGAYEIGVEFIGIDPRQEKLLRDYLERGGR